MELLMWREPTFCQFFLRRETRKLIESMTMATPMQRTFLSWNLIVDLTSLTLLDRSSACEIGVGNLPALERPGPRRRGICLMRTSDARKASYFLASFLTSFLFLLSFLRSSTDWYSRSMSLARSMSAASARMQMLMRGRGTWGSLTVPEKRLSRWGS